MKIPEAAFGRKPERVLRNRDIVHLHTLGETTQDIADLHEITPKTVRNVIRQWEACGSPPLEQTDKERVIALIDDLVPTLSVVTEHLSRIAGLLKLKRLQQYKANGYAKDQIPPTSAVSPE